jgi:Iron-containing redox enzyme
MVDVVAQIEKLAQEDSYEAELSGEAQAIQTVDGVRDICRRMDSDREAAEAAHRILNRIYQLHVTVPAPGSSTGEDSSVLNTVRTLIERSFLASEETQLGPGILTTMPTGGSAYKEWFFKIVHEHPAYTHPLYADYLASQATADDLRYLLVQESTIDAATDDFIALMQVGIQGRPKMEMATNYWDEMGNGQAEAVHSLLFDRALRRFGISLTEPEVPLEVEALVCGNLQLMLGLRRKYVYMGIGYFSVVEYMAPGRFTKLMEAWDRLGLGREGADYHTVHIGVDQVHAEGWFENVVLPLIEEKPSAAEAITRGALYRLNTSCRYLDRIFPNFPSRRQAAVEARFGAVAG